MCVCVCVCLFTCVFACVCACACACVGALDGADANARDTHAHTHRPQCSCFRGRRQKRKAAHSAKTGTYSPDVHLVCISGIPSRRSCLVCVLPGPEDLLLSQEILYHKNLTKKYCTTRAPKVGGDGGRGKKRGVKTKGFNFGSVVNIEKIQYLPRKFIPRCIWAKKEKFTIPIVTFSCVRDRYLIRQYWNLLIPIISGKCVFLCFM